MAIQRRDEPMWKMLQRRKQRKLAQHMGRVYQERIEFLMAQLVIMGCQMEALKVRVLMLESGRSLPTITHHEASESVH